MSLWPCARCRQWGDDAASCALCTAPRLPATPHFYPCARCRQWNPHEGWCSWCRALATAPGPGVEPAPRCPECGEHPLPVAGRVGAVAHAPALCVVCQKRRELPPDAPPPAPGTGRVVAHGPWIPLGPCANLPWYWTEFRRPPAVPEPLHELVRAPSLIEGVGAVCASCGVVTLDVDAVDAEGRPLRFTFYGVDLDALTLPRAVPNCEPLHHPLSAHPGWTPPAPRSRP